MNATISISFDEDNAAFEDDNWERRRLMEEALEFAEETIDTSIEKGFDTVIEDSKALVDRNGNTVGKVTVK